MHARSTGSYSIVTLQPLKGKTNKGATIRWNGSLNSTKLWCCQYNKRSINCKMQWYHRRTYITWKHVEYSKLHESMLSTQISFKPYEMNAC
ncbi:MAG: hypothetical protein ACKESA_00345 [Candidatus Hodgkinia cicadicola]